MIAFDHRAIELLDNTEAFTGIGVVANDVTNACEMGAILICSIEKYGFQRFEIGMYISEDREFHPVGLKWFQRGTVISESE